MNWFAAKQLICVNNAQHHNSGNVQCFGGVAATSRSFGCAHVRVRARPRAGSRGARVVSASRGQANENQELYPRPLCGLLLERKWLAWLCAGSPSPAIPLGTKPPRPAHDATVALAVAP